MIVFAIVMIVFNVLSGLFFEKKKEKFWYRLNWICVGFYIFIFIEEFIKTIYH